MSKQLGPIEISCDAPPYNIVQSCSQLGFRNPEDVRWCRMSHFLDESGGWRGFLGLATRKPSPGAGPLEGHGCSCGQKLPTLEKFTFLLISGKELSYFLGQCDRCRTIFWEAA